jgi:hypothetical protein
MNGSAQRTTPAATPKRNMSRPVHGASSSLRPPVRTVSANVLWFFLAELSDSESSSSADSYIPNESEVDDDQREDELFERMPGTRSGHGRPITRA